ncbi:MAG: hypothetical protein GXY61_10895 [Lentisphaerae bacterium]|nr:hypothetical protein [Lentisphaerota bacterium]
MKINSTAVSGFVIKSMAGYGAIAWNVGSAPIKMVSRANRNKQSVTRSECIVRPETSTVLASVARHYESKEPRVWSALDLVLVAIFIVFPLL